MPHLRLLEGFRLLRESEAVCQIRRVNVPLLISTLRIYARLLQTQAQKFAASETMRTACSTEGCHRYRSKGILERAEFINVPARPG